MAYVADKMEILGLLAENVKNGRPEIVESTNIAKRLGKSPKEICRVIKMMRDVGEVESDQEGQRLLITRQGLNWVTSHSVALGQGL